MFFRVLPAILVCLPVSVLAQERCSALKQLPLAAGTVVTGATVVPTGGAGLPGGSPAETAHPLPAFCRVEGEMHPSADSAIRFEVWMPVAGWNSRLLNVGNGGFAGSIAYRQMVQNLERGYATAGSDAGHQAEAEDASWAYQHPEKIVDFGYRAVHLTAVISKALVQAFYQHPQQKAYFDACSDGGREALMEAQRFPEDYDGILAGAPANNWTHLLTGGNALLQAAARDPRSYLSSMKLPAITAAALAACDAQDGVKDGIVSDPAACHFDPAVLLCQGEENDRCLTAPELQTLRAIYAGPHDAQGHEIFPGLVPGAEYPGWHDWVLGNAPAGASGANYTNGYFRYMVLNDPTWNPLTADVDSLLQQAIAKTGKEVDAVDPDLSRFAAHGGKLIVYHGWNDPAISPWNSVHYFEAVHRSMGDAPADNTMRLYMIPGMEHCAGGPGPNVFGQLSMPGAAGEGSGALDLLRAWVEQGQQPGPILAAKILQQERPAPASEHPARTGGTDAIVAPKRMVRPVCPYPQRARYNGSGDANQRGSFSCVAR